MPFTPIHLGAGLAAKAIGQRYFSLLIFGGSQVLMDIEPLLGIVNQWSVLHGISHTLGGALIIGIISALTGKPISQWVLRYFSFTDWFIAWKVAFTSAFIGTLSHIALDAVMHADMNPLLPFKYGNPWLGLITMEQLHLLCVGLGLAGLAIIGSRRLWLKQKLR